MATTFTLEFTANPRLVDLEYQLKQIPGVRAFLVEPKDATSPVLLSVAISKHSERKHSEQAELTIRRITHTIYDFLHSSAQDLSQQPVQLVTIEGESVDITPLSSAEIHQIIAEAYAGQVV